VKEPTDGGKGTECCKSIHATVSAGAKLADIPPPLIVADPFTTGCSPVNSGFKRLR
jgi:hypothetical protein